MTYFKFLFLLFLMFVLQTQAIASDVVNLPDVVVIGSRNAVRSETFIPVDVFNFKEILSKQGHIDINELLNFLDASFNSSRKTVRDGTDHVTPATLKGLSSDHVLVLINGKKRHASALVHVNESIGQGAAGVDLSAIPAIAIERIEILKGSASAQYGSDAIAGVINIVLKKSVQSNEVQLTSGVHLEGDGQNNQFALNYGLPISKRGGFLNVSAEFEQRGPTDRAGQYQGRIFAPDSITSSALITRFDDSVLAARGLSRSDFNLRAGNAKIDNALVFFNTEIPLFFSNSTFYSFGGLGFRFGRGTGFYRLPFQNERIVESIYPNGFLPEINSEILDRSFSFGLKSELSKWTHDLSYTYGFNRFDFFITNSNNASLGDISETEYYSGGFTHAQHGVNFDVTRYFSFKKGHSLNIAFGGEFGLNQYQIIEGEEGSYIDGGVKDSLNVNDSIVVSDNNTGVQVFPGFRPVNALNTSRYHVSAYGELEYNLREILTINGALRYEDFSDFGNSINGRIASNLKLGSALFLRSSFGTNFKAPSLHQQFFNAITTQTTEGELVEVGIFNTNSRIANLLGLPKLKEETAYQATGGIVWNILSHWSISTDFYWIKVNDRISLTSDFNADTAETVDQQTRLEETFNQAGVGTARFFANSFNTTTLGLDIQSKFTQSWNQHIFQYILAANLNRTTIDKVLSPSSLLEAQSSSFLNQRQSILIEEGLPKVKIILDLSYQVKSFSASFRNTYFGEIQTYGRNSTESGPIRYAAKIVTDATLGYFITRKLKITAGANNLFDVYPDQIPTEFSSSGRFSLRSAIYSIWI